MFKKIQWQLRKMLISFKARKINKKPKPLKKPKTKRKKIDKKLKKEFININSFTSKNKTKEVSNSKSKNIMIAIVALAVVIIVLVLIILGLNNNSNSNKSSSSTTTTTASSHSTWKMVESNYEDYRWLSDGVPEIEDAKTDADAASAANAWLQKSKTDPNLIIGAYQYFLNSDNKKPIIKKEELMTTDGWATDKAVQLVIELQLFLGQSKVSTEKAPANAYNSGINNGTVVASKNPGITGNRAAIKVVSSDGKIYWILRRCGNIVTPNKPPIPSGETDEKLTPKSSDPKDYKKPGDDSKTDAGTGSKPKVPAVTTSAEAEPPVVKTGSDKPDDEITSSSSGTTSRTIIPPVESGVNPSSGTNTSDPGNPWG